LSEQKNYIFHTVISSELCLVDNTGKFQEQLDLQVLFIGTNGSWKLIIGCGDFISGDFGSRFLDFFQYGFICL
jgi:hypothetical protein